MPNPSEKNTRLLYADILRIIAAFSVLFQHTTSSAWYSISPSSDPWLPLNFFNSIARFGVCIFVMISGAFMLDPDRNHTPEKIIKKNLFHLIQLIIFWGIFYGIFQTIIQQGTLKDFLLSPLLIFSKPKTHLWFLYMLAGLYLFTPALRIFTTNASEKILRYTLIALVIFGMIIPTSTHLTHRIFDIDIYKLLTIQGTSSFLIYYLAGFYFSKYSITKKIRLSIYALALASWFISFMGSTYLSLMRKAPDEYFFGNLRPTNFFIVIGIFLFFQSICGNKKVNSRFISILSGTTLGIYLIHPVFLKLFYALKLNLTSPSPWVNVPLTALALFIISFLITWALQKIPWLKKFL